MATTILEPATAAAAALNGHPSIARTHRLLGVKILATGSYVPDPVVTNEQLTATLGFDSDWIVQRTGIRERRHAPPEQATSDLCQFAAQRCIETAGIDKSDIDMLVVGTFTPDMAFPSTACLLQHQMGLFCGAFDVQAACAGFIYALVIGAQFVRAGTSKMCLVVGGDCNSRIINPNDQKTYPLFGDGAGAVLLTPGAPDQGFLSYQLGADGGGGDLLRRPAGGSKLPPTRLDIVDDDHYLQMDGRAVFRWAVNTVTDSTSEVLRFAQVTSHDIKLFVPHQANIRIINAVGDVLGFTRDRVYNNLDRYGNTSAGSIPIALDEAIRAGRIRRGDLILTTGFGAGLTWGSAVIRW